MSLRKILMLSGGGPRFVPGYVYLVDADGYYLLDADGAYLLEKV